MPPLVVRKRLIPRLSRFAWLMGLYAENHEQLQRLFDARGLQPGRWISDVGDGMPLHIDVIGQHRYTTELRLSYSIVDPVTGEPDPSAYLRMYHDAQQSEATHCYVGRRWQDVVGVSPTPDRLLGHRMRMNTFLGKWLQYLFERGHEPGTARFAGPIPPGARAEKADEA